MELSRSPRTTVRHLADRHHVSTRTIQRDLAALHGMGVPVWTRTGPDGGVGLVEGWSSPVTGMTSFELQSLVIGEAVERSAERFLADHGRWFAPPPGGSPGPGHRLAGRLDRTAADHRLRRARQVPSGGSPRPRPQDGPLVPRGRTPAPAQDVPALAHPLGPDPRGAVVAAERFLPRRVLAAEPRGVRGLGLPGRGAPDPALRGRGPAACRGPRADHGRRPGPRGPGR